LNFKFFVVTPLITETAKASIERASAIPNM
jgi:hypothetical protein